MAKQITLYKNDAPTRTMKSVSGIEFMSGLLLVHQESGMEVGFSPDLWDYFTITVEEEVTTYVKSKDKKIGFVAATDEEEK